MGNLPQTKKLIFTSLIALIALYTIQDEVLAQDDEATLRSDLVIEINDQSKRDAESSKLEVLVEIGDAASNVFQGDRGIEWSISLPKSSLTCSLSGRELSMGEDESNDVIVFATTAKIRKDEPGKLTLNVANPQVLQPGFYQGRIDVEFSVTQSGETITKKEYWTVTIAVYGRLLESFKFDRAEGNMLRVGQPASVTATIHTIGRDIGIGTGDLTVEFEKDGSKETALHLPIPLTKAVDPLTMLKEEGHTLHPRWFEYVITTKVAETDFEFLDSENLHQAFVVQMQIPSCFKPGNLLANLDWPQSENAPREASKSLKGNEELKAKVAGGIHVYPPLCSTGELVTVTAVSPTDLGAAITLIFKGPNGESYESTLLKPNYEEGAPAVGDYFEYRIQFSAPTTGQWKVTWPSDDKNLDKALGTPRTFEAWLENNSDQLTVPLTVFASGTPITWDFFPEPYQGSGWKEIREQALVVRVNDQFMKNVSFTPLGIFKVDPATGRLVPYDTKREPAVRFKPSDQKADDKNTNPTTDGESNSDEPKNETSSTKKKTPDISQAPMNVPKDGLAFDVEVELDRKNESHPGNAVSIRTYYFRALIEGTGPQGESVQKLITIPIAINITTEWEWFKTKIGWTIGVIVFGVILYLIYRSQNPKIKPIKSDVLDDKNEEDDEVFPPDRPIDNPTEPVEPEPEEADEEEDDWQGFSES